jgi:hypothetical protein
MIKSFSLPIRMENLEGKRPFFKDIELSAAFEAIRGERCQDVAGMRRTSIQWRRLAVAVSARKAARAIN